MKNIIVLGAGLVGKAIALDLQPQFNVTVADKNRELLELLNSRHNMETLFADLADEKVLKSIVGDFDLIVGALPGFLGFRALRQVIEAGKNIVDISFFPEDAFELDNLAKQKGVTAVVDCGVAPGMGNIILGYHNSRMEIDSYKCYVGGLPEIRRWPYEYKAVFSPIDVIEEYLRPARYLENGHIVTRKALSEPELLDFERIGTLEAFNTDGLRSLLHTMKIPNMIEKTLRYPGTIEYLKVLRDSGFFSYEPVEVAGAKIRPIDLTVKMLMPKWKLKPGEADLTLMRIEIEGTENGAPVKYTYSLFDRYNDETDTISMARTTGYTCTAVARLVASGRFAQKGICPPEYVGASASNFNSIVEYLSQRGVKYRNAVLQNT